jgi:predicted dehydrogenase
MSGRRLRLGLVGCGRLAELGYVPALAGVPALALVAVADPDARRRARVLELASTPIEEYPDARAMVGGTHLDAVIVASPVVAHLDDARVLAVAGVPTLVEKPPAPDAATAQALADLTPTPWVGFNRRFDVGARRLRDSLPRVGYLDLHLEIRYRRASWRAHAARDDALLDLGPHLVDWATWMSRSEVVAVHEAEVADARAVCTLSLTRGRARLVARCDRPHRELVVVRDAAGAVLGRHSVGGPVAAVRGRITPGPHPLVATLAAQLEQLAAAVLGEPSRDLVTAANAAKVMAVLDAARQSAAEHGRAVPIATRLGV